ncbi:MAG: NAD-dependent isocitrate dehydrogenase [Chlorobi bacterium]|nr:MAG: NAD-dependent isocitrate dehydrogenase [Bacteroidota bacterium]KXK33911.1 MAG: Isocitrate dehydrogenase [Chlorobi bacterium OLB6]MBE2265060.1 NAD-dependent isocitrate dehydrogenase [Flavobacteriales bacterium]MBL1161517.1 NAD-dependent isocitrate dehydrogenase [Chlorobiota bacterium]MBW7854073.1 NAD-dependent isocitrate dehydrogenase [Candidatus Kapabacteria bacterium]MCC6330566.1 NAD-dependent isocitrate dehydrogenase [Ignavibacteria bacterium]
MRTVTLIKGDGIGPEITDAVVRIFSAAGVPIVWEEAQAGLTAIHQYGSGVPAETIESIKRNGVALKGPTTTPVAGGHKSVNVTIRKSLELFANVRRARTMPAIQTKFDGVDILVYRENLEDTYSGIEHFQSANVAQGLKLITRQGSTALIRYAFQEARKLGRRKVTCVHKANIHKLTDGLFLEVFRQVAAEYTDLEADDIIVDNCCMQLVTRPEQFDVLVLPNLYGDIVSDICAGLVGGLGVAPGGNIGKDCAVFEAVHGSAPDIAGLGIANPTALLLSSIQMLQYMGLMAHADAIAEALANTLASGIKTRDLHGTASTTEFANAVAQKLRPDVASVVTDSPDVPPRIAPRAPDHRMEVWRLVGADVFVEWQKELPPVPDQVGPLMLTMISNRGTKVWPGSMPDVMLVDVHHCRYTGDDISATHITGLLAFLDAAGIPWRHVEQLHVADSEPRYSKAQGE